LVKGGGEKKGNLCGDGLGRGGRGIDKTRTADSVKRGERKPKPVSAYGGEERALTVIGIPKSFAQARWEETLLSTGKKGEE